jgi:Mg-chelatase subunit ChlI
VNWNEIVATMNFLDGGFSQRLLDRPAPTRLQLDEPPGGSSQKLRQLTTQRLITPTATPTAAAAPTTAAASAAAPTTAAAVAAAAATTAPTAATAAALTGRTRFVNDDVTTQEIVAVERLNCTAGVFVIIHFHKAETARLAGKPIPYESYIGRRHTCF